MVFQESVVGRHVQKRAITVVNTQEEGIKRVDYTYFVDVKPYILGEAVLQPQRHKTTATQGSREIKTNFDEVLVCRQNIHIVST